MTFVQNIFERLSKAAGAPVLEEVRGERLVRVTGQELLDCTSAARSFLVQAGLRKGDRCALIAQNSVRWAAMDLAMMAEGIIAVPLYARQAPAELLAMIKDSQASLIVSGDAPLRDRLTRAWPNVPRQVLLDDVFLSPDAEPHKDRSPVALADGDPVTIIYTSGTSGEAKGVVLNSGNLDHMLGCTTRRLDLLMGQAREPERVFHYLPCCFAGSWIVLLSCLSRHSVLSLSTDLNKLADEIGVANPHYFLNVPAVLERIRTGVEQQLAIRGGWALKVFENARAGWERRQAGRLRAADPVWLALARQLIFPRIRRRLGANLKALICGSAPLARETQAFFQMIGVPVLQVYGLTETTAICTMDHPDRVELGRVGPAIDGVEMKLGEKQEILVRGPNLFPGYWNRPGETSAVLRDGWFYTGDQGEVNGTGNWRIIGRLKNLIVLSSGHNVAPEPIEESLLSRIPGAQQVVLIGNGRSYLTALVTGHVTGEPIEAALDRLNADLPHYKQVRRAHLERSPLTIEDGLLTANGKLRRDAIARRFAAQIDGMYARKSA